MFNSTKMMCVQPAEKEVLLQLMNRTYEMELFRHLRYFEVLAGGPAYLPDRQAPALAAASIDD